MLNTQSHELSQGTEVGYVVIQNENSDVIGQSQVRIENGIASGAIYLADTLKTGYYHVIAYTNYMRNLPANNFFASQILVANRFDIDFTNLILKNQSYPKASNVKSDSTFRQSLTITPSGLILKKRDKANLIVKINEPDCDYMDLSISIIEAPPVENRNTTPIYPSQSPNSIKLNTDTNGVVYLKEDKYIEMHGFLSDPTSGKGLPNRQLILTTPDTLTNFNFARTNPKGQFRFALSEYYTDRELFIKITDESLNISTTKIVLTPKFQGIKPIQIFAWTIDSGLINYIKRSQELIRIQKAFNKSPIQYTKKVIKASPPALYRYPEYSVYPGEYTELKNFSEISREIIPSLKTRKSNNTYLSTFYDARFKEYLPSNPAFFVDGIFTDIASIIPLNSKEINRIDIISTPWYYDNLKLWGIVSIFTKNNLWKTITNTNGFFKIKTEGFYDYPTLNLADYTKKGNTREPDFRQLLYWNSHYHLKKDSPATFDFYTSDYAAQYLIKVSGITDKGEIIEEFMKFEVTE
ncbi:MAG TPA: hypothetical protein VHO72_05725 [Bacteroidales bacterium]|nr:hypothetical protein [Bacteroidales bacterium]